MDRETIKKWADEIYKDIPTIKEQGHLVIIKSPKLFLVTHKDNYNRIVKE